MSDRVTQQGGREPPVVMGRVCEVCKAFVTVEGRTSGVLCDRAGTRDVPGCPYPRAGWVPRAGVRGWEYQPGGEDGQGGR